MKNALKWLENAIIQIRKHDAEIARNESAILELLLQIESVKAYSSLGFDGLYSFCIRTFGWSESQTGTRTQAMYALRSVPELKEKLNEGSLSLTTVAQVERFIRQEQVEAGIRRTPEEKRQVFESFENKTSAEVKLEIAERRGERIKTKLALELDEEAEALWNQVRNLSAHQTQGSALNCLKVLMKTYLQTRSKKTSSHESTSEATQKSAPENTHKLAPESAHKKVPRATSPSGTRSRHTPSSLTKVAGSASKAAAPAPGRFIPAVTRRAIYERDQHRCQNCGSKYALQIDHIEPVAKGGTTEPENLRLLCRSCNLSRARQTFAKGRSAPAFQH